jgi:uncharacterized circularly permuted ATP-grasp superfamily protein/uncharacterized alpha-E superfamily protein
MSAQPDPAPESDPIRRLLAGYRPPAGVHDEMMDDTGEVRPHWREFLGRLADLGASEMSRRFAEADRYLRDSGVFYRVYEDSDDAERTWPLSPIPLLIAPDEWASLQTALTQRARLLETVLADTYGAARFVHERHLPGAFIAGNPEFLRPMVGVAPPGGAHLRIYAADIARAPDGRWWVLSDRTQAPSGAGYSLENRLALSHGLPDIYRDLRVHRLAPFFQSLQAELTSLNSQDDARVCLLTPGPMNETYFEHAYLARYLGFLLVEGEDLTVRDHGVYIRTVSGLKRTEVLLRRLDSDFADPIELNARSHIGVPGLVQAARDGKVVTANALGSGLVEARGLLAFLPALAKLIDGSDLAIPNVATWWLGDPAIKASMLERFDDKVVASAYFNDLPSEHLGEGMLGRDLPPERRRRILQGIEDRGADVVLQDPVKLSTMPVWHGGKLEPRPFVLRVFLTRTGDDWTVMPGGFVRIGDNLSSTAISLQNNARTADAWVLSDTPIVETTLLPSPDRMAIRRSSGTLPSRAADNLFWVGRYVERTEATLRLVRALLNRMRDSAPSAVAIESIASLLQAWSAGPSDLPVVRPLLIAHAALQGKEHAGALPSLAMSARRTASVIRDRLSPDAWRALNDLVAVLSAPLASAQDEAAMVERVGTALRIISSFSGLAQENMTQLGGWRFLKLGHRIERAIGTCRFVRQFVDGGLDVLLELCDSQITYRQRYVMVAARAPVIDLTVLDPSNPRSVAFQIDRIETHLAALPQHQADGRLSPPRQIALASATALRTADAATLGVGEIVAVEQSLMRLSEAIASTYLSHVETVETGAPEADALA